MLISEPLTKLLKYTDEQILSEVLGYQSSMLLPSGNLYVI
jgi:hypothetical protein